MSTREARGTLVVVAEGPERPREGRVRGDVHEFGAVAVPVEETQFEM